MSGIIEQILAIEPSRDGWEQRRPCSVTMRDGTVHERVLMLEHERDLEHGLRVGDLAEVRPSPHRLPALFADRIYAAGESGMGYVIFTLVLDDGRRLAFASGGPVDFPNLPAGVTMDSVVEAVPHEGRDRFTTRAPGPTETMAAHERCAFRVG